MIDVDVEAAERPDGRRVWHGLLAGASFLFHGMVRFLVLAVGCGLQLLSRRDAFAFWHINSERLLEGRLPLLRVMMVGPRWNTAAACAHAGPFRVRGELRVPVAELLASCEVWTMMVFRSTPRIARVAHISSTTHHAAEVRLELPSGHYFVNLRCYRRQPDIVFPELIADGETVVAAVTQANPEIDFHHRLHARSNWFYRAMQFHIVFALRHPGLLPPRLVERLLLPVGDPSTVFRYGGIQEGQALSIRCPPATLRDHAVFATLYDTASFPTAWDEMAESGGLSLRAPVDGFYLIRCVRTRGERDAAGGEPAVRLAAQEARC